MTFIQYCKSLDWQKAVDICNSLGDLNDSQYRFVKGRAVELTVEELSRGVLKFVGEKHKDFDCKKYSCSVELKSLASQNLYTKKGIRKKITVKFNNSNGTNKADLDPGHVADYLLVVLKNGVVLLDKETVIANLTHSGDGWNLCLRPDNLVEISGKIAPVNIYKLDIKAQIDALIKENIKNIIEG